MSQHDQSPDPVREAGGAAPQICATCGEPWPCVKAGSKMNSGIHHPRTHHPIAGGGGAAPATAPQEDAVRSHKCMRCKEEFACPHGPLCAAGEWVMPDYYDVTGARVAHCPLRPDWDWIRAYGDRRESRVALREAAPAPARPQGWQDISTAPKDGTPLWLVEDGAQMGMTIPHQAVGYWRPEPRMRSGGVWQQADSTWLMVPTHWMPLPDPPSADPARRA